MKVTQLTIFVIILFLYSCQQKQTNQLDKIKLDGEQSQSSYQDKKDARGLIERDRVQQELDLKKQHQEEELYNRYINNSLNTGSLPYLTYYGSNSTCDQYGCSQIKVTTPDNSDVLVTIKRNNKIVRHAYIKAADSYTFSLLNGEYQTFFYYGKGWNPTKLMKNGELRGGFISNEHFGKDEPQLLDNNILQYELILQQNGNFSTKPSNPEEAL